MKSANIRLKFNIMSERGLLVCMQISEKTAARSFESIIAIAWLFVVILYVNGLESV